MLQTLGSVKTKPHKIRLERRSALLSYVHPYMANPLKSFLIDVFMYLTNNLLRFTTFATKALLQKV
jgi:hypothetical protein